MPATTYSPARGPYGFRVPPSAGAVSDARRHVMAVVRGWELPLTEGALRDVELLASELITNAFRYTKVSCVVCVCWDGARLRVEVTDTDSAMPEATEAGPDSTQGRGLVLVDALAVAWGAEPDAGGKRVWFEIGEHAAMRGEERLTALVRAAISSLGTCVLQVCA